MFIDIQVVLKNVLSSLVLVNEQKKNKDILLSFLK